MYNPFPLTANTISGVVYLDMLEQWGCCHSLVTTFLVVTLPAKLGTTQFSLGCNSVSGIVPTTSRKEHEGPKPWPPRSPDLSPLNLFHCAFKDYLSTPLISFLLEELWGQISVATEAEIQSKKWEKL